MEWQPISTAPKDDTRILVFDRDVFIASWRKDEKTKEFHWLVSEADDDVCSTPAGMLVRPSHWMPLPPPP